MAEIVTSALSLLGKAAANPAKDAALRQPWIIATLQKLHLDPKQPPKDFYSLYAYTLVESLYGRPAPLLKVFEDQYVQQSFYRSFSDNDWTRLNRELADAVERNRETKEFGHLPHNMEEELQAFICKFQDLVSRSRMAYEVRLENKLDDMSEMLEQVVKARSNEEERRQQENPERAEASPAERLKDDVRTWFQAVGYRIRHEWSADFQAVAMLIEVPQRRPGRFDLVVALCVEGELAPYHMDALHGLVDEAGAAEGWGIAQLRVSKAAKNQAAQSGDVLFCYSFDDLIDLEADFEPYIDWLEQEVRDRHIDSRFVPLSCRKEEVDPRTDKAFETSTYGWQDGGLDNYVDAWLADPVKKHLSLLGEFGMGKSWFALHLAGRLAAGWKDAKERGVARPRIPLVIPLRDYAKQTSVSALLSEFFFNKHPIGIRDYEVFSVLNRMGRFLLIFDGFDEMASRTDRNTMVANFWELAKVAEPGAKVLLSSRTEYFPEAKEARDLFGARVSTSVASAPSDGPTFEIVELMPFDDEQIRQMLSHLLTPEKLAVVMDHEDVRDLMRRPVMSELVIDALPEIEQGAAINLARIYLYAVKRKMDRDVSSHRTFTSRSDKLFFLCEVAWEMIRTNQLTLNYRDFPDKLRACFGSVVANSKDLDYWEQDMRNQSMLVRNSRGDYGPSHKSLLEFFVAFRFAAELGLLQGDFLHLIPGAEAPNGGHFSWSDYFSSRGEDGTLPSLAGFHPEVVEKLAENFGAAEYNPVVFEFLVTMIKERDSFEKVLIEHIRATAALDDPLNLGGNCANLLAQAGGSLVGASLEGVNLNGFGRTGEAFFDISLEGASLAGADVSGATLAYFNKRQADFRGARLSGSRFLDSRAVARQPVIHSDGAISVIRTTSDRPGALARTNQVALHWASGNILEEPAEVPLVGVRRNDWSQAGSVFQWTEGTWGHADARGTVIRRSDTGDIISRVEGSARYCVDWGGRRALILMDREKVGMGWKIVDPASGEILATVNASGIDRDDVRLLMYRTSNSGVVLWAVNDNDTVIYEGTSATRTLVEVAHLPVGMQNTPDERTTARIMASEDRVYLCGPQGNCLDYSRDEFREVFDDLVESSHTVFSPDERCIVVASESSVQLLEYGSTTGWKEKWSRPISSGLSWTPVLSSDGTRAAMGFESGEFSVWSLNDGARLTAITFNTSLQGAHFSGEGDLENSRRESILLSGGIVEG
ncbi:NACHT domain-containing protein [Streptomyces sp. NPDC093261]|uniref:NACHT domain-containing protein n=1 Tax=Streptomyces sp. NPDC093261 TaxID=3366037 RepID=UPI003811354E